MFGLMLIVLSCVWALVVLVISDRKERKGREMKASITYQVVTYESCSRGDQAEHGWYLPGGWKFALEDEEGWHDGVMAEARAGEFDLEVGEAIREAISLGICEPSDSVIQYGSFFHTADAHQDMDGNHTSYSLHIKGVTGSSLRRIARLLRS